MRVDYTQFDDAEHVRRTLRGDKSAFDVLVRQYHGMVYSVALARLDHDHDQADELTQEVFLRAWLHLDRLAKPDYFPAWLVQIARNLATDWQRRDRRKSALVQLLAADHPDVLATPASGPSPRDSVAAAKESSELYRSLNQLPPDHRELLLLHYGEGLSQSEIARNLGVSPSTVMRRLEKALSGLRQIYNREGAQDLVRTSQTSRARVARTLAVIAAAFLLAPHQKSALAGAAGAAAFLPKPFPLKKVLGACVAGATAGIVIVMLGNYGTSPERESVSAGWENSPGFLDRSVEVRSVTRTGKDSANSEAESTVRNPRQLLKSAASGAHAAPKSKAARSSRKAAEPETRLASAEKSIRMPAPDTAAQGTAAAGIASGACPTLDEMIEQVRKMEQLAGSVQFTYRSAVTVINRDNQPEVKNREGEVTVKDGKYLIKVREDSGRSQTIYHDPATGEVTAVVDLDRPSVPGQHTVAVWKADDQIPTMIRAYNPLAALIVPPYGPGSHSDFIVKAAQQGHVSVKCSPGTTTSVTVSSEDWSVRFQREQFPFFDQLQRRDSVFTQDLLKRTVAEFSSLNGVIYPSLIYMKAYYGTGRFGGIENATTTSLTMRKVGDAVPPIKDPFANLPNARRVDMKTGELIEDSNETGRQQPSGESSTATTDSEPTLAQKFRDPEIAKQYPQPGMVTGQVIDPEGRPVPNLQIDWAALTQQKPEDRQKLLSNLPRNAIVSNQPLQQTGRSTTDANGNFVMNFSTTGTAVLATDYEPYARTLQVVDLPTTGLVIRIPSTGATVQGTVRNIITGEPVADAHVRLTPLGTLQFGTGSQGTKTFKLFAGTGVHLETDANGNFRDDRMPAAEIGGEAGTDTLIPVKMKYLNPENPVLRTGRVTQMPDLYVYPGYTLRGYVYEAGTSRPLAGVKVAPGGGLGTLTGKRPEPATTDAVGYYEITRLQPLGGDVPGTGEEPALFFENMYAEAEGYKTAKFGPEIQGTFNPQRLIIEHNFELTPGADPEKPESNLQHIELLPRQ